MVKEELKPLEDTAENTCTVLKAISNPHRLTILCRLVQGEHSVGELEHVIGLSQSALSQHLARLRRDNLVSTRRSAQTVYYAVSSEKVTHLLSAISNVLCTKD